ncbi:hypothetical protein IH574_07245 [Candidatus Bathyarchaeota archaeon]|nr:hypothetical protein [Candidatus Bathyarchaeota archaeon]
MKNLRAFINSLTEDTPELVADYVYPISAKKGIGVGELKNQLVLKMRKKGFSNPFEYLR